MTPAAFPLARPRRLRRTPWIRDLVAEHRLSPADLIWPIFVRDGLDLAEPISSLPGVDRLSIDRAVRAAEEAATLGIPCLALFPYTDEAYKDPEATEAWNPENLVCRATRAIKAAVPDIGILLDVALDPYNSDGHDGLVRDGVVLNDETLLALEKMALVQAEAGCDILGPSDMMDGRIGVIRRALEEHDFPDTAIMSYAAKYASCFYGPFRDAVGSSGALKGDKKTYQMDPANTDEALREVATDLAEGADMVMVKPGLPYLDVCARVKAEFRVPTFAYQVSGEYAMLAAAEANGWLDGDRAILETLARLQARRLRRHPDLRRPARRPPPHAAALTGLGAISRARAYCGTRQTSCPSAAPARQTQRGSARNAPPQRHQVGSSAPDDLVGQARLLDHPHRPRDHSGPTPHRLRQMHLVARPGRHLLQWRVAARGAADIGHARRLDRQRRSPPRPRPKARRRPSRSPRSARRASAPAPPRGSARRSPRAAAAGSPATRPTRRLRRFESGDRNWCSK